MATRRDHLEKLRQQLLQRRDSLRRTLGEEWQLSELGHFDSPSDVADAALETGVQEMHFQAVEMEARELALIEWALHKFQRGSYGICENCGRKIGLARLEALPFARYCIACQRELEQAGDDTGWNAVDWERVYEMERAFSEPTIDLARLEAEA
ncbi:MAG: TraR/DksA C4-type zinc finger protein [Gemmatales bacterium]|nr:TraR/DksA family transcriptional regulator [Gemmatales bacterium]MCS7159692.1 TraR/DksA family transcriptional regulator [Gemmatales bacterium]MDW8174890.1 TraR/DksA C4-type zinc finger protein [Gemmatales bacterium]MDW8223177.1 TraR/DksA C4-type zinc finger protein [Gemmatales bacterium]